MNLLLNIDVPNVGRAITFYRDALGWRHMRSLFDGGVAEMLGAGCRIYLIERASSEAATATGEGARTYDRHWTPIHPDFIVNDIEVATARAVSAGAIQETPIRAFAWGKLVTLSDPFGNGFCLIDFPDLPYADQGTPGIDALPADVPASTRSV